MVVVQGKCIYEIFNNRKGDSDLGWSILKMRAYFDVLLTRKKVFSESSHLIERHIGVVVEVLEVHISASFEFCLDEEFVDFLVRWYHVS